MRLGYQIRSGTGGGMGRWIMLLIVSGWLVLASHAQALARKTGPSDQPPVGWERVLAEAQERFGAAGVAAAEFLSRHRPERDANLDPELVLENIEYALRARGEFPWAESLSDALFFNDVLPYAVLDETRDRWRARLYQLVKPLVAEAQTAEEAAQAINRQLFQLVGVQYSTQRKKPNQSSLESLDSGLASCTGLSILLIEACRSVAIPARLAGIASWVDRNGNHSWVELHDGQRWRFTGACEYDPAGLDRGWFAGPASQAIAGHRQHAIWASSWESTGHSFPLVWARGDDSVPAVDVTENYARQSSQSPQQPVLALRLWNGRGGPRLAAKVQWSAGLAQGQTETFADPDDINRVAELPAELPRPIHIRLQVGDQLRAIELGEEVQGGRVIELFWDELGLTAEQARRVTHQQWGELRQRYRDEAERQLEAAEVVSGEQRLRFLRRDFGEAPTEGPSLWISMHGGGGAPTEVNDRQWRNQIRLYQPPEGIYLAPRAPSDTWNLWHRSEVDRLFDQLIAAAIVAWGVDPNRIYLLGYSAGGDGVYQLAPRMADRFAAAAMMAGHPNDAQPDGLRNLPFAIFMGANDAAYNRNGVAKQWAEKLGLLQAADADGYPHLVRIYPDLGHWMDGKDAEAIPWMAQQVRSAWPKRVVWRQGNTPHRRFYWLSLPDDHEPQVGRLEATVSDQRIDLACDAPATVDLLLSDQLVDLDQPIEVWQAGRQLFGGLVARSQAAIADSLELRRDPAMAATARLRLSLSGPSEERAADPPAQ